MARKTKDEFDRKWITENALEEIQNYEKGVLTLRGLHYRLVSRGMTNSIQHYKRVISAMTKARWNGLVDFDTFSDNDREMIGRTHYKETDVYDSIDTAKDAIKDWMTVYYKSYWDMQDYYVEVFIEKKALQGVFEKPCRDNRVALGACKGYPSLTFLNEAAGRFKEAYRSGKNCIILYFGDYDPSGEDIPRSIKENLWNLGAVVEVERVSLMEDQVIEWDLPPAPAKVTDSRTANWDGLGQVELDAVEPQKLRSMCSGAIKHYFDDSKYEELKEIEQEEREIYIKELKLFVQNLDVDNIEDDE